MKQTITVDGANMSGTLEYLDYRAEIFQMLIS